MAEMNGVLHGWKEISAFLGVSVRTAQRWERVSGLPVRRIQAQRGHSAFASAADVRAWLGAAGTAERAAAPAAQPPPVPRAVVRPRVSPADARRPAVQDPFKILDTP